MKNSLKIVALTSLLTTGAYAASSATLGLSGVVASVNDLSIVADANATTLDILAGEAGKLVGVATESSNNSAGYKITMSSANAGQLINGSDTTNKTAYQIKYGSSAYIQPSAVAQEVKNVTSLSGLTTSTSNINVNVTALTTATAGTYTDTVTFTIAAN